jgi:hypothetical protein
MAEVLMRLEISSGACAVIIVTRSRRACCGDTTTTAPAVIGASVTVVGSRCNRRCSGRRVGGCSGRSLCGGFRRGFCGCVGDSETPLCEVLINIVCICENLRARVWPVGVCTNGGTGKCAQSGR